MQRQSGRDGASVREREKKRKKIERESGRRKEREKGRKRERERGGGEERERSE